MRLSHDDHVTITCTYLDVLGQVVEVNVCVVLPDVPLEAAFVQERGTTQLAAHSIQVPPGPPGSTGGGC